MTSSARPDLRWAVESGLWRTHKEQSDAARNLLCSLLGEEITIEHDSQGAPYVPGRLSLHVSISHCRTAVAVAVSNIRHVGIDIESRRKVSLALMERVCTTEELAAIHASEDHTMAFLRLWTRKEAVLKMRGTGIRGFGSIVNAANVTDCKVEELNCGFADTVASLAMAL